MTIRKQAIRTTVAALPLLLLLVSVQPDKLPIYMLIVPFILLFAVAYNSWLLAMVCALRLLGRPSDFTVGGKRLGRAISGFLVIVALVGSVGQLTARDVVTLVLVFLIGYFYAARMAKQRSSA